MNNLFPFLIVLSHIHFSQLSYRIQDLNKNDEEGFAQQVALWTDQNSISSNLDYSRCNGSYLLGGYHALKSNTHFQKTYRNLPAHDTIYFSISLYVIDYWTQSDQIYVYIFTHLVFRSVWSKNNSTNNICGNPDYNDFGLVIAEGNNYHEAEAIRLRIYSSDNSNNSSYGFRDIVIVFENQTDSNN